MTIDKAIDLAGGAAKLGRKIGVTSQAISQWRTVPVDRVLSVCAAVCWKITPHEVRPDIYPNPQDGIPDRRKTAA